MQRLRRLLAVDGEVRRDGDRLAERDEDAPAEPRARVEAEPDRYDREAPGGVRLVAERDPRGARLDPLHVRRRAGGALGIDGDEPLAFECLVARREHLRVAVQLVRVVRLQVDGNHPQGDEEPRHERIAEERGGGEVVHLPRESTDPMSSESIRLFGWLMQRSTGPMPGTRSGCRTSKRSKKNQIQNRAITLTTA